MGVDLPISIGHDLGPALWRLARPCCAAHKSLRGKFLGYVRVGRRTRLRPFFAKASKGYGRQVCTTREALLRSFTDLAELDEPGRCAKPPSLKRTPITSRHT